MLIGNTTHRFLSVLVVRARLCLRNASRTFRKKGEPFDIAKSILMLKVMLQNSLV